MKLDTLKNFSNFCNITKSLFFFLWKVRQNLKHYRYNIKIIGKWKIQKIKIKQNEYKFALMRYSKQFAKKRRCSY